jgi:hypothetical protein
MFDISNLPKRNVFSKIVRAQEMDQQLVVRTHILSQDGKRNRTPWRVTGYYSIPCTNTVSKSVTRSVER